MPSSLPDPDAVSTAGNLAPINARLIAFLIDAVVFAGVTTLVITILLPDFAAGLGWLLGIAYLLTRDSLPFLDGQSVGKKAMKLRAVTSSGAALTGNWNQGIMRNLPVIIPFFPLVELFLLMTREDTSERGQRFGDQWAKTKVVVDSDPQPIE